MTTRLRAHEQEETPTTRNRRGIRKAVSALNVCLLTLIVKVAFACRAQSFSRPDLGSGPQFDAKPLLKPRKGPEVRENISGKYALNGATRDASLAFDCPHGGAALSRERCHEAATEHLGVHRTDRRLITQAPIRPGSMHHVLARRGVTSGPRHGPSLSATTPWGAERTCYSNGTYKSHLLEGTCPAPSSSAAPS